jgi:hypothetical protein
MATLTARRTFEMTANESLWDVARHTHDLLRDAGIDHAIVGGVAVCLHGYRRTTVDLDLLIRPADGDRFRAALQDASYLWDAKAHEFHSPSGIPVQVLLAGESSGRGQPAKLPEPTPANVAMIEDLPALSLKHLIQAKLACGLGDLRRTHKDFADVVELIAANKLDGSFARFLHPSVRDEFRELVRRAT